MILQNTRFCREKKSFREYAQISYSDKPELTQILLRQSEQNLLTVASGSESVPSIDLSLSYQYEQTDKFKML